MHLSDEDLNMLSLLALRRGELLDDDESQRLVENGYATWEGPALIPTKQGNTVTDALLGTV